MILKNLMETKQLDFNQPFLSVRRHNSTLATSEPESKRKTDSSFLRKLPRLPSYKSDLKSGPIRNPGSIPFVWEKTPGKPKDESKSKPPAIEQPRPPVAPKLPPGRILNASRQTLDRNSESSRRYHESRDQEEETRSSSSEDSDDEAFMDALDTLSRSESFFYNCSLSGVSGVELDNPDVKPFSSDPQTRDLMMGRFLPAAKAMTSETLPQYATKKPIAVQEQSRPVQKIAISNKQHPLYRHGSYNEPYHPPSKDEYDNFDGSDGVSVKGCGLFSRMCMKSSLCFLNPVPEVRMHARPPVSSVRRTKTKSLYSCSWSKVDNEKRAGDIVHKKPTETGTMTQHEITLREGRNSFRELIASDSCRWESASSSPVTEKTLYIDSVHKMKPRNSDFSSLDMKEFLDYNEEYLEAPLKGGKMGETKLEHKTSESGDFSFRSSSGRSINDVRTESTDFCSVQEQKIIQEINELSYSDMPAGENFDSETHRSTKSSNEESYHSNIHDSLALSSSKMIIIDQKILAPPLPKSPSDSWLMRALPNMSSKNPRPSHGTSHCSINQASKESPNLKWENLVKTSNVQHGHLRFSEELLTPIPEV